MTFIRNILFPIDFSDTSEKLAGYAHMLAKKFSAQLHLLFVARLFDHFTEMYVAENLIANFQKVVSDGANQRLAEFIDQHFSDIPNVRATVLAGDIAETILRFAETMHADLVVLGTHGRKGMEKILFGSVAEKVLKGSTAPIFLVNPYKLSIFNEKEASGSKPVEPAIRKILFPVDLSSISAALAPYARSFADAFAADTRILRVVRSVAYFNTLYVPEYAIETFDREMLEGAQKKLNGFCWEYFADATGVESVVQVGEVAETILNEAQAAHADLIVMGTHGRKGWDKIIFGSIAERVAKTSAIPVLFIHPRRLLEGKEKGIQ